MLKIKTEKLVSVALCIVLMFSVPTTNVSAAAKRNKLDQKYNVFIDAMDYVGYNIDDYRESDIWLYGSILQEPYATTRITYGTGTNGKETVKDPTTVSGKAPNLKHFRKNGFVCASFVSYVYLNYLPNVAGYDTSVLEKAMQGKNHETVADWHRATEELIKSGYATRITNKNKLEVGDIVFVDKDKVINDHISIYVGKQKGHYCVIHCGNKRGPDFCNFSLFRQFDSMEFVEGVRLKLPLKTNACLSSNAYTFDGKVKTPSVTVKDAAGKTIDKKNYSVVYDADRVNIGTYKVRVDFRGEYTGSRTLKFTINPPATNVERLTSGKRQLNVKWKVQSGKTTGYQIKYSQNKNLKKAKTVTVKGNLKNSASVKRLAAKVNYYVSVRSYKSVKRNGKWHRLYSEWSKPVCKRTK